MLRGEPEPEMDSSVLEAERSPGTGPAFSVIIPTYQRQPLLDEALESVMGQTMTDFELIVIDDAGSPPAQVPEHDKIRLLRQAKNGGKSAAINRGLTVARGEFIAFLDDDDRWEPTRLETAYWAHKQTGADVIVIGLNAPSIRVGSGRHKAVAIPDQLLRSREILGHMGEISIRQQKCPPFDPSYRACEDLDWGIRVLRGGASFAGLSSAEFRWRRHDGPRYLNDKAIRIDASRRLLSDHRAWYSQNPRARAFRHYRLGVMELQLGNRTQSIVCLWRSVAARPRIEQLRLGFNILRSSLQAISIRTGESRKQRKPGSE